MLWNKEFYEQDYISFLYQWNVQSDSLYATHILKISNKYTNSNKQIICWSDITQPEFVSKLFSIKMRKKNLRRAKLRYKAKEHIQT